MKQHNARNVFIFSAVVLVITGVVGFILGKRLSTQRMRIENTKKRHISEPLNVSDEAAVANTACTPVPVPLIELATFACDERKRLMEKGCELADQEACKWVADDSNQNSAEQDHAVAELLKKCTAKNAEVCYWLVQRAQRWQDSELETRVLTQIQKLCAEKNVQACKKIVDEYFQEPSKERTRALEELARLCKANVEEACPKVVDKSKKESPVNITLLTEDLEKYCEEKSIDACEWVFLHDDAHPEKKKNALEELERQCAASNMEACHILVIHTEDDSAEMKRALAESKKQCTANHLEACQTIMMGKDAELFEIGMRFFQKRCDKKDGKACSFLADHYNRSCIF